MDQKSITSLFCALPLLASLQGCNPHNSDVYADSNVLTPEEAVFYEFSDQKTAETQAIFNNHSLTIEQKCGVYAENTVDVINAGAKLKGNAGLAYSAFDKNPELLQGIQAKMAEDCLGFQEVKQTAKAWDLDSPK